MSLSIFLSGCCGRMGRTIRELASEHDDLKIVAGSDLKADEQAPFPVYADASESTEPFDVLIDFSSPAALPGLLEFVRIRRCPAVFCTTGYDRQDKQAIRDLSGSVPVFYSANMSIGINLLIGLASQAARHLYPQFNIEIVEAHHRMKLDAPSGTALAIADALNSAVGDGLSRVCDRSSRRMPRPDDEIGLHAIRGGSIVGDHTVLFAGPEEILEITHRAQSRQIFARGALAATRFMAGRKAGFYDMNDLLFAQPGEVEGDRS